jgi:AcrR family transcriptional regulator
MRQWGLIVGETPERQRHERLEPDIRRAVLLRAAAHVAESHGMRGLSHARVAHQCGCSARTVYRWAATRKVLRDRVARYARDCGAVGLLADYEKLTV